ncbi:MAG TPA: hypothetical protein PKC58_11930 [Ignavibacteria bacterium]|nr:hypothetical protein [Ignavibacteria bacterium]
MDNEEKHIDIAEKLKSLEKIEASHNFTHNLHAKIIEFESEKRREHAKRNEESKGGFLKDLFGNLQYPWLVPAAGFTILIFFVFYITYQNKSVIEADNNASLKNEQQTIQSEKQIIPAEPEKPSEDQAPPADKEKKELTTEVKPQSQQSMTGNDLKSESSISEKKVYRERTDPNSESGNNTETDGSNLNMKDNYTEETSPDGEVSKELSGSENQGAVSEETGRTMANVKPELKDTNKDMKYKNDNAGSILLKMNKIDIEALERIREEISK